MGVYKDLIAFKKAYNLAMKIFQITKKIPSEEKYSIISQIRRSSRSVCANRAEAYKRRKYPAHFLSKLWDSLTGNCETEVWLNFSIDCGYLTITEHRELIHDNGEVGKLFHYMINNPDKFR